MKKINIQSIIFVLVSIVIVISAYSQLIPETQNAGDNIALTTGTIILTNCSQEQTNISTATDCTSNLNYTGFYSTSESVGACNNPENMHDGDYSTNAIIAPGATCVLLSNYSIPSSYTGNGVTYQYSLSTSSRKNVSIPASCLTGNTLSIKLISPRAANTNNATCHNGSQYILIPNALNDITEAAFYEENIYWDSINTTGDIDSNIPLGSLFSGTGLVFIIIMGGVLVFIVKYLNNKK